MAGGTFYAGETKVRPGNYHRETSSASGVTPGAINGVAAGLFRANWGPLNEVVELDITTVDDVRKVFGSAGTGVTWDLITEMFNGGARSGYFVRIGAGGTAPSVTLKNTDATPGDALTITGKYVGKQEFTVSISESLTNEDEKVCTIYIGTEEFESVSFAAGNDDAGSLIDAINDGMKNFTAAGSGTGSVAIVTQKAFTAGTNPTAAAAQYSAGMTALEPYDWNCMAVDTEDTSVHLLVAAYLNRIFAAGSYPMACVAETKSVALETRLTHAAAFNNKMMHYVLNPAYDSAGTLYDGYRNAARIAGYIAAVATNTTLTDTVVTGYATLAESLTNTQIISALKSGCIVLSLNKSKQVKIEQGINTLVTPADDEDDGWKKIRRVKCRYELIQRCMASMEGTHVDNDDDGRATAIAKFNGVYETMVGEGKLVTGGGFELDSRAPEGDSAWFRATIYDKDSLEKTYTTFVFNFTAPTA